MTEEALHGLLLDCGFRNLIWTPLRGQKWAVVGEIEVGLEITVACMAGHPTAGPVLHVPSETARELLLEMLAQNGSTDVVVVCEGRRTWDAPPWVPVAIGAGAVALFGWVISTINR